LDQESIVLEVDPRSVLAAIKQANTAVEGWEKGTVGAGPYFGDRLRNPQVYQPPELRGLGRLSPKLLLRHREAVETFEQVVAISRAPIYIGFLGLAYGPVGRREDAECLLRELEERSSRGEYVTAFAEFSVYVGLGDVPAISRSFAKALAEITAHLALCCTIPQLPEAARSDPEDRRLLDEMNAG
jgi:hypothetical protein